MSREIKFRAWMREQEYMTHLKGFYKNTNTCWFTLIEDGLNGQHVSVRVPQDAILMQYTGLNDKNGVEIYEGDVLSEKCDKRSPSGGHYCGTYGHHPENAKVVEWDTDMWKLGCFHLSGEIKDKEVIGNIHANPELLGE